MSIFWWVAIAIAVIWFVSSLCSKSKAHRSFAASDDADPWFESQRIDPESVMFSSYEDPQLSRVPGSTVLCGYGKGPEGGVGFAIEVISGRGVVASEVIQPSGIASHHRTASIQAKASGRPLLDVLVEMAEAHRARHPQ